MINNVQSGASKRGEKKTMWSSQMTQHIGQDVNDVGGHQ